MPEQEKQLGSRRQAEGCSNVSCDGFKLGKSEGISDELPGSERQEGVRTAPQFYVGVQCYHTDSCLILVKILFDTTAGMNLVSQQYVLSMGWMPNPDLPLPKMVSWGNRSSAHLYGVYEVMWKATNSWGQTKE